MTTSPSRSSRRSWRPGCGPCCGRVARHDASPVLRVGELEIDRHGMEVRVAGELVSLTPTEYRLLLELAEHSGVV